MSRRCIRRQPHHSRNETDEKTAGRKKKVTTTKIIIQHFLTFFFIYAGMCSWKNNLVFKKHLPFCLMQVGSICQPWEGQVLLPSSYVALIPFDRRRRCHTSQRKTEAFFFSLSGVRVPHTFLFLFLHVSRSLKAVFFSLLSSRKEKGELLEPFGSAMSNQTGRPWCVFPRLPIELCV